MPYKFFYSETQLYLVSLVSPTIAFAELEDDGQIVPYTEATSNMERTSNFPDAIELGVGEFHHIDLLKNHPELRFWEQL